MPLLQLLCGFAFIAQRANAQPETFQRAILEVLYDSTHGDTWINKQSWRTSANVCSWFGITCDAEERVIEVTMVQNNITGEIPPSLYELPHLEGLTFVQNNVTDAGLDGVNRSTTLQHLVFVDTMITSLAGIENAPDTLSSVYVARSPLNGSFPTNLCQLTDLLVLELTDNGLNGTLPTEIGKMESLRHLELSGNDLIGTLPSELGNLTDLVTLLLDDNYFSGALPTELSNMTELATLHITDNQLTGQLLSFDLAPNLGHIILAGNQLTGTIPSDLWNEENNTFGFRILDLTDNCLSGSIPLDLTRFEFLDIEVTGNFLTNLDMEWCLEGEVNGFEVEQFGCNAILCPPGTFSVAGRHTASGGPCKPCENAMYYGANSCETTTDVLAALYYQTNGPSWIEREGWSALDMFDPNSAINGSLFDVCTWFGVTCNINMTVMSIDLEGNNLTGPVPPELFIIPDLESVSLSSNAVDIDFSSGFTPNLTSLELDSVGMASLDHLHLATSLQQLHIRCNNLGGSLLDALSVLSSMPDLASLDLTNNRLDGMLPPSFAGFPLLDTLLLGSNELTGNLVSFEESVYLTTIDLSDNSLDGSIPPNLLGSAESNVTLVVDVSLNRLGGALPTSLARFQNLTLDLVDNLIDAVPEVFCSIEGWNDGAVGLFGCNGILCPPETNGGRQKTADEPCLPCNNTLHYGQTYCPSLPSFRTAPLRPFSGLRRTYCPPLT